MNGFCRKLCIVGFLIFIMLVSGISGMANNEIKSPEEANINWRQFEGTAIRIFMAKHYLQEYVQKFTPEFEELTGIKVEFDVLSEVEYFAKLVSGFESKTLSQEVYMANMGFVAREYANNWIAPLEQYINNPKLTDKEWFDYEDFWNAGRMSGTINGTVVAFPFHGDASGFIYRKDIFDELGISPPKTFEDVVNASKIINEKTSHYGFVTRGGQYLWVTLQAWVRSYGGSYLDENWDANLTDPNTIKGVQAFVDALKYGPPGITNYGWTEVGESMANGASSMFYDSIGIWSWLSDPDKVSIDPKNLVLGPPLAGPDGKIETLWGAWLIGLNNLSKNREAGWLFIQWATSKPTVLKMALEGGIFPSRESIVDNEQVIEKFGEEWLNNEKEAVKYARPMLITSQTSKILDEVDNAVQKALNNIMSVEEALQEGQKKMQAVIDEWKKSPESEFRSR